MIGVMLRIAAMSIQDIPIILAVFAVRKLFELIHISKRYIMVFWLISFFFLIFPWKVIVPWGLWNQAVPWHASAAGKSFTEQLQSDSVQQMADNADVQKGRNLQNRNQRAEYGLTVIRMLGCLFFYLSGIVSYVRLRRSVICSIQCENRITNGKIANARNVAVYEADEIRTPFVLGCFRPSVYLPSGMDVSYREYVIAHEMIHIKRKDYLIKAAAYFVTCLHWFHPIVWLAYDAMAKDMEMACDEETVFEIGTARKKDYATVLLELSVSGRNGFVKPPAFGKGDIKMRIQNIMQEKKTTKKAAWLSVAAGIVLTGIFLTANESGREQNAALHAKASTNEWLTLEHEMQSAPEHWKYAGFIGAVGDPQDAFVFEEGKLHPAYFPHSNHSMEEPTGVRDDIAPGVGWKTLMAHGLHDLYTGAQQAQLETEGVKLSELETQSEYRYFYFVKENYEHAYVLSLSAKEFSEPEAIAVAKTVRIMEEEGK